jgi:hypothetical protein
LDLPSFERPAYPFARQAELTGHTDGLRTPACLSCPETRPARRSRRSPGWARRSGSPSPVFGDGSIGFRGIGGSIDRLLSIDGGTVLLVRYWRDRAHCGPIALCAAIQRSRSSHVLRRNGLRTQHLARGESDGIAWSPCIIQSRDGVYGVA